MKDSIKETISISILGPEMGVFIGLGFFLGHRADIYYNTQPIFTWCGMLTGIALAACALLCASKKTKEKMSDKE